MRLVRLVAHQFRYDQKAFWRNVPAVFFSLVLPVIFLLIFATLFGGDGGGDRRFGLAGGSYYVPGIIVLGVVSATLLNVAIGITLQREQGILKRLRATPLPPGVFIAGRALSAIANALLIAAVIMLLGRLLYGVEISGAGLAGVIVTCTVAAAAFCCLGFAISTIIPNEDAAPAVTNAIVLPVYFISGVFFPVDDAPSWLRAIAETFPVRHFTEAMLGAYSPRTSGTGVDAVDLLIVAAWGIGAAVIATRRFRWMPRER